ICKHFDDCLQRPADPNNKDADGIGAGVKARNGQIVLAGAEACARYGPSWALNGLQHRRATEWLMASLRPVVRFAELALRNIWLVNSAHCGLMLAALTTLPHFSVSVAISVPKSAGEPASAIPPKSPSRAFMLGSAKAALISLLRVSMISGGVAFGAAIPPKKPFRSPAPFRLS